MSGQFFRRIKFRIGIAAIFTLLSTVSILSIVWFVYERHADLVAQMAADQMESGSKSMIAQTIALLDPVADVVDALAGMGDLQPATFREKAMSAVLLRAVRNAPQIYSLYVGFADGEFVQAYRFPPGTRHLSDANLDLPEGTVFGTRAILHPKDAEPSDTYTFLSESGEPLLIAPAQKVLYDPRTRPFFLEAASHQNQRVISDLYTFATIEKTGLTISRSFGARDGFIAGAVGCNITLQDISKFLKNSTPGNHGISVIIDQNGNLIAHPDPARVTRKEGREVSFTKASDLPDPAIQAAMARRKPGETSMRFTANDGQDYVAMFSLFPSSFERKWEMLVVVPTDDFVGDLKRSTREVLILGFVLLALGVLLIASMSRTLTKPIEALIETTDRIRRFELDDEIVVSSRIVEIHALSLAVGAMRAALKSFGRCVPKSLVRDLLTTGRQIELGGESREITVMFTDLVNFSTLAEKVTPQALTERVSAYLNDVSLEVIHHHGQVDKYIGDAVMALFNAPVLDPHHVENACLCALHAMRRFEAANREWSLKGWEPLSMRVGLHTDRVIVGVIGSSEFMGYTALGDGVNIASRLEGMNKTYGTQICVSHTIYEVLRDRYLMRPLDSVAVKGRQNQVRIYELMGKREGEPTIAVDADQLEKARLTTAAFEAWIAGDPTQALARYRELLQHSPGDPVAVLYVERCTKAIV